MKVDNLVVEKFHEFKLKKTLSYLVLGFSDDISKIVVLKEAANTVPQNAPAADKSNERKRKSPSSIIENLLDKKWAEMLDTLPDNDVRYVIIDVFYDTNDGSREEIIFIAW